MIKVLVVDDHDLVRTGITRMLADIEGLQVVGQADCGEDCLKLARELKPDVVLMDVKMPGIGGLEATRKLLRSQPDIKVVVVTVCEEDPFPTRLMQAGAAGYMTKGAGLEEMVQAIRQVFAGQRYISPQIAQQLALKSFQPQQHDSPFDSLSEREIQIALMIANCHKVQSISDKLCLSPKTVNTYRYRIFEKLSITSDVELALLAVRHGMVDAASYQLDERRFRRERFPRYLQQSSGRLPHVRCGRQASLRGQGEEPEEAPGQLFPQVWPGAEDRCAGGADRPGGNHHYRQ